MKLPRILLVALPALLLVRTAQADPQAAMLRALSAKYSGSVVTLRMVLKASAMGQGQQAQLEADAIVIDPSGLVATTNTAIDPTSVYSAMMGGGADADTGMSTSVVSIKIVLASGQELPARVVLRDKDRNIAIIRPLKKPAKPLVFVNFKGVAGAQLGDPLYIVGRLGKAGSRQPQAVLERIAGVVEKPRHFYVLETTAYYYVGDVAFNEHGQPLGLISMRMTDMSQSMGSPGDAFLAIVTPTSDVWEVALQAPQANAMPRPHHAVPGKLKPVAGKAGPAKAPPAKHVTSGPALLAPVRG